LSPAETLAPPADGRRGRPFTLRLSDADRLELEKLLFLESQLEYRHPSKMPRQHGEHFGALGSFMVWAAKQWRPRLPRPPARRRSRKGKR
jgi:hypothetical protein